MKPYSYILWIFILIMPFRSFADNLLIGKKVLYISSYDSSNEWSGAIDRTIYEEFANTGVQLSRFEMDAKRHPSEIEKQAAAKKAKALIEKIQPDVVITSDDDAAKYLIASYYRNSKIPFVFCGVNWDASQYNFSLNVTGMLEFDLADALIKKLRDYAHGDRVGYLSAEGLTETKTANFYRNHLKINLHTYFVNTFAEWQKAYQQAQQEVDILLINNPSGILDWNLTQAIDFIEKNSRIPSGTTHFWLARTALVSLVKLPSEQGRWAAQAALNILKGTKPSQIPITRNHDGRLLLNTQLANSLGIKFKPALLKFGTPVNELNTLSE
jgi:ABC-type uncharacterized transport system substrate-binding protein